MAATTMGFSVTLLLKTAGLSLSVALLTTLAACAKVPEIEAQPLEQVAQYELLSFIENGMTTRTEVLDNLGIPAAEFEKGHILTYRIGFDDSGMASVVSYLGPRILNLVLVFSPNDVLEKHSLVGSGEQDGH